MSSADTLPAVQKEPVSPEQLEMAEATKNAANVDFREGRYHAAIRGYTAAIAQSNGTVEAYFTNRAAAYLKTEEYGYAMADATRALEINPKFVKAYYRRASGNFAVGKFKTALRDFTTVCKVVPNDAQAKLKRKECEKIVRRMLFEEAIAGDDEKSIFEAVEIETMAIESSYDGPVMESEELTLDFVKAMIEYFRDEKLIHKKFVYRIIHSAFKIVSAQPTLVDVTIPKDSKFTVCGDIHGQFYDLLNIFELNGLPSPENPYLFNGDFVDRGSFSVEVIVTLMALKVLYPTALHLNRGNHESERLTQIYGFNGEMKAKYGEQMLRCFHKTFNNLPLSHRLNKKVLVMHGGLFSDDTVTVDDIANQKRDRPPPDDGIMSEMLWSDPHEETGRAPSKRGVGVHFGPDVTKAFLAKNNLDLLIRSHEVKDEGYEVTHDGKCITIFSAPNYCDQMGNKGAFINLDHTLTPKFVQFSAVPHPNKRAMAYSNPYSMFMS